MYKLHIFLVLGLALGIFLYIVYLGKRSKPYIPQSKSIDEIDNNINTLVNLFLNGEYVKAEKIIKTVKIDILFNEYHNNKKLTGNKKFKIIERILNKITSKRNNKNTKILATISMICLPLSVISGIYGSNFNSMIEKNGVYTIKFGEFWLYFVLLIYSILFYLLQTKLNSDYIDV